MRRIIAITLSATLMFALFAACGKKDEVKEELTTIRDDISNAVSEGKNDMNNIGDDLTENGNVTNQTGQGAIEEAITDISEMLEGNNKDNTTKAR